jgi:uncharacterized glyoxalase superfamily protein PhnB
MSSQVGFVAELGVKDVRVSVDFYTKNLGCELVDLVADRSEVPAWAEIALGASRLMFERADLLNAELPSVSKDLGRSSLALVLRTESKAAAAALLERLKELSWSIETGPTHTEYGSLEFSVLDPDRYVVLVAGRD